MVLETGRRFAVTREESRSPRFERKIVIAPEQMSRPSSTAVAMATVLRLPGAVSAR